MGLLFCFSLLCGVVYYLYTPRVHHSTVSVDVAGGEGQTVEVVSAAAAKELESPHLLERTARRFGLKGSAREIQLKYSLRNEVSAASGGGRGGLQIETWTTSRDLAGQWGQALVEEYDADRAEKHEKDRAEIFEAFTRELKDAAARSGIALDGNLQIRNEAEARRAAAELQQGGAGSSAEVARMTKLIDMMGRVRIQLVDRTLDAAAKRALIAKAEAELAAAASAKADSNAKGEGGDEADVQPEDSTTDAPRAAAVNIEADYQAAAKRFEAEYEELLRRRSAAEENQEDAPSATPGDQKRPGVSLAQKARPNWERMTSDLQKKVDALEQRWRSEQAALTFRDVVKNELVPTKPTREVLAAMSVGLGLLLALGVPLLVESLHRAKHDLRGVESAFQLRELGFMPEFEDLKQSGATVRTGFQDARLTESFRRIRMNLAASASAEKPAKVVMITSAMPKEGKTVVAANLALSFAREGERTLLVDGDLQRGRAHRLFGLRQNPGLSNVLFDEVVPEKACRETTHQNLWVLSVGNHLESAADLLGSDKLTELMVKLRGSYDRIILDAPPVLGLAEAGLLQKHADGALLVVWSGRTPSSTLKAAVEVLQQSGGNLYGFVRSRPDLEMASAAEGVEGDGDVGAPVFSGSEGNAEAQRAQRNAEDGEDRGAVESKTFR
jgi:capsular exopolysaccharide synthesis family protein